MIWAVKRARFREGDLTQLLKDGWEPFAVIEGGDLGPMIFLRKLIVAA